jgi:hypothetical protein
MSTPGSKLRKELHSISKKSDKPERKVFLVKQGETLVIISEEDQIYGIIRNREDGVVKRVRVFERKNRKTGEAEDETETMEILRFNGEIGKVYKIDNITPAIGITIDNEEHVFDLHEAFQFFRSRFSLTTTKSQYLNEILTSFVSQQIKAGNFELYASSPITVIDDIVKVSYGKRYDLAFILKTLSDFYPYASHQEAFKAIFAWTIVSPLHDELKRRSMEGVQTPLAVLSGKTKGGKTTLANTFIGKGFELNHDSYFYPHARILTKFTLMKHLGDSNLPALFDDLPQGWIFTHKEDLKSYVQTGHFGDRGRSDQTLTEYRGRRSFIGTINDDIRVDDDLALSTRLLIIRFTEYNKTRENREKFDSMFYSLPAGFMYEIFRAIFEGKNINEILKVVEKFDGVDDWINYGIERINELFRNNGIKEFTAFKSDVANPDAPSNAMEIAEALRAEFFRTDNSDREYQDNEGNFHITHYNSPMAGEIIVETGNDREYIYFTGGAFKRIMNQLGRPYSNATNFLNNILSNDAGVRVENEGRMITKRMKINQSFGRFFEISIPILKGGSIE